MLMRKWALKEKVTDMTKDMNFQCDSLMETGPGKSPSHKTPGGVQIKSAADWLPSRRRSFRSSSRSALPSTSFTNFMYTAGAPVPHRTSLRAGCS